MRDSTTAWIAAALVAAGMLARVQFLNESALWCDEAESSINGLTILETGVPGWKYMGLPVFENTLTEEWRGHPEYEFRDSTYSAKGVVVYHGWLPIYAIAASQWLCGLRPDLPEKVPRVRHGVEDVDLRTIAPRLPALFFSLGAMVAIFRLGTALGGAPAGLSALALMALNAQTVDFGIQARYYAATLCFNAVAALCLWCAVSRGRWRDFLLLGLSSALLFHTHLFSTIAFSGMALTAAPALMRHPGWFVKAVAGGALAAALTVPCIVLSGFLGMASTVPKARELFDSHWDAVLYALDRPVPLALLTVLIGLVVLSKLRPGWFPRWLAEAVSAHAGIYVALFAWLVSAYAGFHLLMPAASFFVERLTLVLWTPYVLLTALFVSDIVRSQPPRRAALLALSLTIGLLAVRNRLAFLESTLIYSKREEVRAVIHALSQHEYTADTKFYGTPNEHLTYTYYTGLPVQSIAPVRREFLESYPGPIVYIERQLDSVWPTESEVAAVLAERGIEPTEASEWEVFAGAWNRMMAKALSERGLAVPDAPSSPEMDRLVRLVEDRQWKFRRDYFLSLHASPTMRDVPARTISDLWLGFFYRFVKPGERIGRNLNILPRLRSADIQFLPEGSAIIFRCPPLREAPIPPGPEPA